jgi:hypothetical protein
MKRIIISVWVATSLCLGVSIAQAADQATVQSDQVWGTVTRCNKDRAEVNISLKHGLWSGDILYVYRPSAKNKLIDKLYVNLVDEHQAVGTYESMTPEIDDRVLFLRRKPSTDERINRLVGSPAKLSYKHESATSPARLQSVLILSVRTVRDNEIESFHCVPEEPESRTKFGVLSSSCDFTVPSKSLITAYTDGCRFFPDPQTGFLLTEEEWLRRDRVRAQNEIAKADAERKKQEVLAIADAERKKQEVLAIAD